MYRNGVMYNVSVDCLSYALFPTKCIAFIISMFGLQHLNVGMFGVYREAPGAPPGHGGI